MMDALKKIGGGISAALPHITFCWALMLLVFYVINIFNTAMQFLDSRLSQRFALCYAIVTLLAAVIALIRKRVPVLALLTIAAAVMFIIPDLRALAADDAQFVSSQYYSTMTLVTSLVSMVFAVADIVIMRKAAKNA